MSHGCRHGRHGLRSDRWLEWNCRSRNRRLNSYRLCGHFGSAAPTIHQEDDDQSHDGSDPSPDKESHHHLIGTLVSLGGP